MARGKHAVSAHKRRAEAAHEVIDRLTDQLAEAKLRARRMESEAIKVPHLIEEISRLRGQVEAMSTPAMDAMRASFDEERAEAQRRLDYLTDLARRLAEALPHDIAIFSEEDIATLRSYRIGQVVLGSMLSRESRRIGQTGSRTAADELAIPQDNMKSVGDNLNGAASIKAGVHPR